MAKEWQFLNFTSIEDSTDHRTRTFIRSHVTKRQHLLAKRKEVQPPKHNLPQGQNTFAVQFKVEPEEEPDAGWASRATTELLVPASSNSRNHTRRLAGRGKKLKPANRPTVKNIPPERRLARILPDPSNGRAEPFNCYPVPYQTDYDRILHHMMTVFAPRAWPALKINSEQGLHWEWFMTQHALAEPALFYVRLLFASGDLARMNAIPANTTAWLRYQAVKTINEALSEPTRATSDALILAVGRIALHECLYGNRETSNRVHRPAQARMIAMRGGMDALNFPELVKRLMRWADDIMARQGGTERLLEVGDESQNFSLKERIEALESWVPPEPDPSRSNGAGRKRKDRCESPSAATFIKTE